MSTNTSLPSQKPSRIDFKVVEDFERLASQVPVWNSPKIGADYGILHPLDTAMPQVRSRVHKSDKAD